jgi:hypothetical protein
MALEFKALLDLQPLKNEIHVCNSDKTQGLYTGNHKMLMKGNGSCKYLE